MSPNVENTVPVIAIDGPVGSGKGTISRLISQRLGWNLLDSGALYRVLALAAERHAIALDNAQALATLAAHLDVQFITAPDGTPVIVLEGEGVTEAIRSEACGEAASRAAALPEVRTGLLARQRAFREPPGLVADGRDMGTVVFPDAALKVYLSATPEERAGRRYKQLKEKGLDVNLISLLKEISARDERDASRPVAPLKPAPDAEVVDTTGLGIEVVVDRVMQLARRRLVMS
ncbi:MAG: (d)CMP kinase [Gammaproteobacteria bacterium]|nr:(d)CMP kinase [Gammaproteobacteria bacterium]